ncbi:MAG TPA: YtxH domain-containing protein [Terrimesophilobacter sp.]|nr:YtxH domain-containing protein [Terrimesophilobacter sp.]
MTYPTTVGHANGDIMRGKLVLLVGIGIGYVLGARAGRERYEAIKRAAGRLWNDPRVQHQVRTVEEFAKDKAPDVVDFLGDTAKKVVQRKSPAEKTASRKPAASSTSTTAKKS